MEQTEESTVAPRRHAVRWLVGIGAVGLCLLGVGLALEGARAWASLLLVGTYAVSTAAAALLVVALGYVTGAGWSTVFRRVPEAVAGMLPYGALLLVPAALGVHALYHWSHADAVADDPILAGKAAWLNVPFFLARGAAYLAIWILFVRTIRAHSVAQDRDGAVAHTRANVRWSTIYLVVYALTASAATFDWLMSLDPHWFSTMFAVYGFAGSIITALSMTIVAIVLLRRAGHLAEVTEHHLHDLGRLLFGFCCFWAYIWFSQFMLIWYANIPEETGYYVERLSHGWELLFFAVPVLLWIVPFFVLLPRSAKRSESVLLHVAIVVLVGRWLDLYVTIEPSVTEHGPVAGLSELGATLLGVAVVALGIRAALKRAPLVPRRDPYLEESLHHHVGPTM